MVEPANASVSIVQQCHLLSISRSGWYYEGKGESPLNLSLMRMVDEQFLMTPYYGSRQMTRHLRRVGYCVSRKRVRRLMRWIGLEAIYQPPKTSLPHPEHKTLVGNGQHVKVNSGIQRDRRDCPGRGASGSGQAGISGRNHFWRQAPYSQQGSSPQSPRH